MSVKRFRYIVFLKDIALLSLTSFGGPHAHIAHFEKQLVAKRKYLSESELSELNALCQVLPGPTSTQTLSAIGYKLGGAQLAYLTLLVWALPSIVLMTAAGLLIGHYQSKELSLAFTRFIQPMAVGFVAYAAYTISIRTINSKSGVGLMILAAVSAFYFRTPFIFPIILLIAGVATSFKYKSQPKEEKEKFEIRWSNFLLWAGVLILAAVLGGLTKSLPIRLFENFYRNGSLVFGGGQVLTPMLYTEFVEYAKPMVGSSAKPYVEPEAFLSGFGIAQSLPGPIFSFASYLGVLAMNSRGFGVAGEITGAFFSAAGIFLPGTFLIFFMIRIWDHLKRYRPIRASLEGITAANAGLVACAAVLLFLPLEFSGTNISFTIGTFCLLVFTRIPSWLLIPVGLLLGFVIK
ncbi:MAG: chromate efflux transporter [Cyclobacteriaceae bacterium]